MEEHLFYIPLIQLEHNLKKPYDLGNGFALGPFPRKIEEEYRLYGHGYFKRHYGDQVIKEAKGAYCLEYLRPPERFKSAGEVLYKLEDPIITFLIVLRILKPTQAGFRFILFSPPLTKGLPFDFIDYRLKSFHPRVLDENGRLVPGQEFERFGDADIPNISFYFGHIMGLLNNEYRYRRIFNTLRFFDLGYRSATTDSRLIYFSIAMEVLFKPLKGKLTHGMGRRISRFLGHSAQETKHIYERFMDIINFRARIIHGDMTYVDITKPDKIELVHDLEHFLRLSLQKVLREADLIETFSSLQEREKYLLRLTA